MRQTESFNETSPVSDEPSLTPSLRRRLKLQPLVPHKVEDLLDQLWARQDEYESVIDCSDCGENLHLDEVSFGWPYGRFEVYFPGIPAYHCTRCGKTFLPDSVRQALAECVEATVEEKAPTPVRRNPRAEAFALRYSG